MKTSSAYMENQRSIPLQFPLAMAFGDRQALLLQQIRYWMTHYQDIEGRLPAGKREHYRDGRWWVFNSYKQWKEGNFGFWSEGMIRRMITELENRGILLSEQFNKSDGNQTKWYTIDFDAMDRAVEAVNAESVLPSDQNEHPSPVPSDQNEQMGCSKCADGVLKMIISNIETENTTETTPETTEQTPPPPLGIIASAGEGERDGGGGDTGETSGESAVDLKGQDQDQDQPALLPEDCKSFLATLHGALGQRVRIMDAVTKLAWWYEVKDAQNPGGLLAHRLKDTTDRPLPGNIRKAREMLNRGVSVEDVVKSTTPRVTRSRAEMDAWEAAGWDPRVLMGLPDTSKAGV